MSSVANKYRKGPNQCPDPAEEKRELRRMLQERREENERLWEALETVRRVLKNIAHRTESTATREDAHQAIIEIADALDGGGDES